MAATPQARAPDSAPTADLQNQNGCQHQCHRVNRACIGALTDKGYCPPTFGRLVLGRVNRRTGRLSARGTTHTNWHKLSHRCRRDVTKHCANAKSRKGTPRCSRDLGPAVARGRSPGGCGALCSYDYESSAAPTRLGRCHSYYASRGCSAAPQRPRSTAWPQLASRRRCCSVFHTQYACTCLKAQLLRCHSPSAA